MTRITAAATRTASLTMRWRRCGTDAVETRVSGIIPTGSMIVIAVANAVAANWRSTPVSTRRGRARLPTLGGLRAKDSAVACGKQATSSGARVIARGTLRYE